MPPTWVFARLRNCSRMLGRIAIRLDAIVGSREKEFRLHEKAVVRSCSLRFAPLYSQQEKVDDASVRQHFGTFKNAKPVFNRLDCYFNIDSGTGRIRGASIFGPADATAVLRPVFPQFREWGVAGINVTSSRATGGTGGTSSNNAGLPGVGFQQNPIEYGALTHHTNLDTYERLIPQDVKEAAVLVASTVWHVAMLPRFTKEQVPALVEPR